MNKGSINKKASDLFYTLMTTAILQLVLQVVIYPTTTKLYGETVTGNILYFIGLVYMVPSSIGTALNHARLVIRKNHSITNHDFMPYIGFFSCIVALIYGYWGLHESHSLAFGIAYGFFSVLYMLRIFAAVEFRLNADFKGYFLYFCIISIGYLIGFGLFLLSNIWLLIFIVGEGFGLLLSIFKGNIFKNDGISEHKPHIAKTFSTILVSTIVRDGVNQFDKVIIKQAIGEDIVTHYNAVSLIAKTSQMLIQPINSLLLTYLTIKDATLTKKQLIRFTGLAFLCGALFYLVSIIGTPIFVYLLYPNIYAEVMPYNLIVNAGLILGFISTMFMSILLTQGKTGLQMTIQCVWGGGYIIAALYYTARHQIWGLAYVMLFTNGLKLLVAIAAVLCEKKPKAA